MFGNNKTISIVAELIDTVSTPARQLAQNVDRAFSGVASGVGAFANASSGALDGFGKALTFGGNIAKGVFGTIGSVATGAVGIVGKAITGIKDNFTAMTEHARWASLFIGTAMLGIGKSIIGVAADVEQTRVAFETLLKSPEQAGALMEWMTKFSLQTPLTRAQIQDTAQQLIAFGHSAEQAKTGVIAITEATSALGIDAQRVMTLTKSLGQIYSSEKVRETEFNELRLQGVKVNELLAKAVNEGKLKLDGYAAGVQRAGGATKEATKAYQKASEDLGLLSKKLEKAKAGLESYEKGSKKTTEATLSHQIAVETAQKAVDKAKGSISAYTKAEANRGKVIATTSAKLTQLTQDQEKMVREANSGREIAKALEDQLIKTYGGAAARQVKTLSGMMSNFADVFQYVVQKAMGISADGSVQIGGAFDRIRNAVAKVIEFLLGNVDKIANFFNKLLSAKEALYIIATFLMGMFYGAITGILAPVMAVALQFTAIALVAGALFKVLLHLAGGFDGLKEKLSSAGQFIANTFTPVVERLRRAWYLLKPELVDLATVAGQVLIPMLEKVAGIMNDKLKGAIQSVSGLFDSLLALMSTGGATSIFDSLKGALLGLPEFIDRIKAAFSTFWTFITTTFGPVIDNLKQSFADMKPALDLAWQSLQPLVALLPGAAKMFLMLVAAVLALAAALLTGLLYALGPLLEGFVKMTSGIIAIVTGFFGLMMALWTGNWDAVKNYFLQIWNGIKMIYDGFANGILEGVKQFVKGIINFFVNLYNALVGKSIIPDMVMAILEWFTTLKDKAIEAITGLVSGVTDKIANMAKDAWNWGKNLVTNYINGIKENIKMLGSAGMQVAEKMGLMDLFREHGGIIPGPVGAPMPVVAHGGERVIPRSGSDTNGNNSSGGVTVNFYGSVQLDSPERVQELADKISRILGRQNELARYGAGY